MDKKSLSRVLKKVFIGSLTGIYTTNASNNNETSEDHDSELGNRIKRIEGSTTKVVDNSQKLILKKNKKNELEFMSHRSHRSHSSHRSHYSSSSGSRTPSTTPSSPSSGIKPSYFGDNPSTVAPYYELGSRILRKGMSGSDVTELINILLKKKYLVLENGGLSVSGIYEYDEVVEDAVRRFQLVNSLEGDGICGVTTVYYLKNK